MVFRRIAHFMSTGPGAADGRRPHAWLLAAVLGAANVHAAQPAVAPVAGTGAPAAAGELSFEQLTSMEVSGVSKAAERTLDAPAAVTVIGGAELRAFGFRTLAEVLTVAPVSPINPARSGMGLFGWLRPKKPLQSAPPM